MSHVLLRDIADCYRQRSPHGHERLLCEQRAVCRQKNEEQL